MQKGEIILWVPEWQYTKARTASGWDGHLCIRYPQYTDIGKEHLFENRRRIIVVSPNETNSEMVALKSFYTII